MFIISFICEHKMFMRTLSALSVFSVKVYVSFVNIINYVHVNMIILPCGHILHL